MSGYRPTYGRVDVDPDALPMTKCFCEAFLKDCKYIEPIENAYLLKVAHSLCVGRCRALEIEQHLLAPMRRGLSACTARRIFYAIVMVLMHYTQ